MSALEQPGRSPGGAAPLPPAGPAVRPSVKPKLPDVPEGPHPVLEQAGFFGGIQAFSRKVQAVVRAHEAAYGHRPGPGLTLDIVRSDVPEHHYASLFTVPKSPTQARLQGVLVKHGIDPATAPSAPGDALARDIGRKIKTPGDINRFIVDHADEITAAINDPESRRTFESAFGTALATVGVSAPLVGKPSKDAVALSQALDHVTTREQLTAFFDQSNRATLANALNDPASAHLVHGAYADALERLGERETDPARRAQTLTELGLPVSTGFLTHALGIAALAGQQISMGLVLGPVVLAKEEGAAIGKSVSEKSLDPLVQTNKEIGKAIGKGVARDFTDPGANPGNLALDILGIGSLGFGAYARIGAAGTALRAGLGARVAARALLTKPLTGTYHLGEGADIPLSGNPLVAAVQRLTYDRRSKGLTLDEGADPIPTGVASTVLNEKAATIVDKAFDPLRENFSMENKTGRQLRAADRVERAVRMSLVEPLARATGAAKSTSLVFRRLTPQARKGLTVGEQKAIQVMTLDDAMPLDAWQRFHERAIDQGIGDEAAHRAQLALLEQARKVIDDPSPKFAAALAAVRDVSNEQTRLRIERLGLTPEAAEGRVASMGEVVRGDVSDPSRNALAPALFGGDDILRMTALGNTPEQIARYLVKPGPEAAGEMGRPHYSSYESALKSVRAKLDTPEAKVALTPVKIRSDVQNPGAVYLLYQQLSKQRRGRLSTFFRPQPGPFGVVTPGSLPELNHYFTGDVIRAGDFRIDATRIAAETYGRTVGIAMKLSAWKRLHDFYATDEPRTPNDIPIRDERAVSDELRNLVNKAEGGQVLSAEDVLGLPQQMADDIGRYLMPHADDYKAGDGKWKWVDERYLASEPRSAVPTPAIRAFSIINEPLRDATLFIRPAYLLNALGNAAMLSIDEGFFAIPNFARAMNAKSFYGPKATRILDGMAGEGRMVSYAPDVGSITKVSHAMAGAWGAVTDRIFRRAAVIFYLRKLGYRTHEQITQVLLDSLHDPAALKDVTEASQRGKKSVVELDNLTRFEKNSLRHFIFVYPWVSRSAVWSLRTIAEHPAQSAIYAELGKEAGEEFDPILKHLPAWMRDKGVIPVGWNADGSPKVMNLSSINSWSTLGDVVGLAHGDQTFTDLLGPGAELIVRLALERDRFGRKYHTMYVDPILDALGGLPQLSVLKRAGQQTPADVPPDVRNIDALVGQEHADTKRPLYVPGGFWNTYGPLIASGLAPRVVDRRAVQARWWAGQPWEDRHRHEAQLMQDMAGVQSDFIDRPVPNAVRNALHLTSLRTEAYHAFAQDNGRTPTLHDKVELDIETLRAQGRINDKDAKTLEANLKKAAPDDLDTFRQSIVDHYAGGKALSDWHRKVTLVARAASRQDLDADIQQLVDAQILPRSMKDAANADDKTLHAYGRQFLAYDEKIREFVKREKAARAKGQRTNEIAAELRVWMDEQDKPVTIDGKVLPPLPRLAIAHLTPTQLAAHLTDNYTHKLSTLSALDKSFMGLKSTAGNTEAWAAMESTLRDGRKEDPTRSDLSVHNARIANALAKQIDDYYKLGGSFVNEVKLSLEPRWRMLKQTRLYLDSPNQPAWDTVFTNAETVSKALGSPDYLHEPLRRAWRAYVQNELLPWAKTEPGFWRELQPYIRANPSFLEDVIAKG